MYENENRPACDVHTGRFVDRSALAVLRRLAGLLEAVLLALDGPRVAGQEAGLLQRRPVLGLHQDQRPGDGQAQRTGLPGRAAAIEVGVDVEGCPPGPRSPAEP